MNYGVFPHETLFYNVICDFTTCVEQECIPVGCVPSTAVAVRGMGEGGVVSFQRGMLLGGKGCDSGGVLLGGLSTKGAVSARGPVSAKGHMSAQVGCICPVTAQGNVCLGSGVYPGGGVCLPDPPVNRMTDRQV